MTPDRPLHPAAEAEVEAAGDYYALRDADVAVRFIQAVDRAIEQIVAYPDRYPRHLHDTRRLRISGFPYLIIYRERADTVQVIAIAHGRREPGYWSRRLDDAW